MAIIVGDDGQLHAEQNLADPDPTRRLNAQILDLLAWRWESGEQLLDAMSEQHEKLAGRVTAAEAALARLAALEAAVSTLEALVLG